MSTTPKKIPTTAIRNPTDDLQNHTVVLGQLKEVAEVGQRLRGDPRNSFVRVSELVDAGIVRLVNGTIQPPNTNAPPGSAAPSSRKINTSDSLQGGGDLTADRTLTLVGDAASPGNNMVYGTNGSGVRGWYTAGAGGSTTLAGLTDVSIASPADGQVLTYVGTASKWENKPASGGGGATAACAFTVNALTTTHSTNLTTEGTLDWMCPGGAQKASGFLIQNFGGALGAPISGTFFNAGNNWTNSCSAGDASNSTAAQSNLVGQFSSSAAGAGQRFTVPADTHAKFLRIYSSSGTPYKVRCIMSDGNSYDSGNITSVNSQIVIQYNASRDGCQMTVMVLNEGTGSQNIGTMGITLGTV